MQTYYVGIDQHQKFLYVTIMDKDGAIVQDKKVETEKEEIVKFFKPYQNGNLAFALEAGPSWYWLYDLLETIGEVSLVHPLKVKAIASARIKTDKIDSKILAHLLRTNLLPTCYVASLEIRYLREFLRRRHALVKDKTRAKNRVHVLLAKEAIKPEFSDIFGILGRKQLLELPLKPVFKESLESYLKLIEFLEIEIRLIEKKINKLLKDNPEAKSLIKIKGIGKYLSLLIISEIADISRFKDSKSFVSYCGLAPSTYQSGNTLRHGRITKQGPKALRWALVEAAQKAKDDSKYKEFYLRIEAKRGRSVAKVALARKLAKHIYHILKKQELNNLTGEIALGRASVGDIA